ncbi:arginine N-succinyltransferase [Salinisphaera sp. USBA-960]|nr:arginine N-succinyltransferase [Salifodinibacter halophilus]NNC26222.1 arginine N-succinyltransferase [Salifodinibacter halophilus]
MTLVVRPAALTDLDSLVALASQAQPPLTNLPAHRERLGQRIEQSVADLARTVTSPGAEYYVFVVEDQRHDGERRVVGTASLRARTGAREAYYTWRREMLIHASQQLDVRREVAILSLSHELSAASLLCAYALADEYRNTPAERLLRRARLAFAAQHPERFTQQMAVAMPGWLDADGYSPFWESVGRHFFDRDFQAMNELAGVHSKSFIAEIMPPFPLYESLLSEAGRASIGTVHQTHDGAMEDLTAEGFRASRHIDLFDGGLILETPVEHLHAKRYSQWHPVRAVDYVDPSLWKSALVANQQTTDFRCTLVPYACSATHTLGLQQATLSALDVTPGEAALAAPIDMPMANATC